MHCHHFNRIVVAWLQTHSIAEKSQHQVAAAPTEAAYTPPLLAADASAQAEVNGLATKAGQTVRTSAPVYQEHVPLAVGPNLVMVSYKVPDESTAADRSSARAEHCVGFPLLSCPLCH